jgi:SsrA-binding protein
MAKADDKAKDPAKVIARNRKASHQFVLEETIECGIELRGTEVKVLRTGQVSIDEAYAQILEGELWVIGMTIPGYDSASWTNHQPKRQRKLLVHRRELEKLRQRVEQKKKTLIPLRLYFNERGIAKMTVAVASGKKMHDKRDAIREREEKRDILRAMRRS